MAQVVPFTPREVAVEGEVATSPTTRPFDRARFRAMIEVAIHSYQDVVEKGIALLDRLDGDADFEPEPVEDDGTTEPSLAALIGLDSQFRWIGFDQGGASA